MAKEETEKHGMELLSDQLLADILENAFDEDGKLTDEGCIALEELNRRTHVH